MPREIGDLVVSVVRGHRVLGYDEQPRPSKPDGPLPEASRDPGSWRDWPWTLLGRVPEATRAAWNSPSVVVWHLQREPERRSGFENLLPDVSGPDGRLRQRGEGTTPQL